jgi:cAMP phosphodiesterase
MEIRVLGCYGSQIPGFGLTGFLIDGKILLDAGAVTSVLTMEEQTEVDHILITHAHLDHIRELASLADNICYSNKEHPLAVIGTPLLIETLKRHIFNGIIWPDFSKIPSKERPALRYLAIRPGKKLKVGHLDVTAIPVNHKVETVAYVVEERRDSGQVAVVFVGDTGPTDEIWRVAGKVDGIRAIFIETSLPEELKDVAELSGHLTPAGLAGELKKLGPFGHRIYLFHMKCQYREQIRREIDRLQIANVHPLHDGQVIRI